MNYKKYKLRNGSSLGIINIPGCYTVTISAFVKAGFRYDPKDKIGLAHFTEHMLFNGTTKYPSPTKLAWAVERYGGWQYAFTWVSHQQHTIHLPKENLECGVEVLLEKLTSPLLSEDELEKEKSMVKEEILRNRSDPEKAVLDYAWQPLFYSGTNLARPYSGTERDIEQITVSDIEGFINEQYLPSSTVFTIATDLRSEFILKVLNKYTARYNRKGKLKYPQSLKDLSKTGDKLHIVSFKMDHTALALGIKTVPCNNNDRFALEIIKDLLAGFYGSRLPQRLRNEGLIYNWNIWQDNFEDFGYLIFRSATAPSSIYKFVRIVLEELKRLTIETVLEDELEITKGRVIGDLVCNLETGFDLSNWFGLQELISGNVVTIDRYKDIYKDISANEILKTAKRYMTKGNIYLAILGTADKGKIAKMIDEYF